MVLVMGEGGGEGSWSSYSQKDRSVFFSLLRMSSKNAIRKSYYGVCYPGVCSFFTVSTQTTYLTFLEAYHD